MFIPMMMVPIIIFQFITSYFFATSIAGMATYMTGTLYADIEVRNSDKLASAAARCSIASALQVLGLLLFASGLLLELYRGRVRIYFPEISDALQIAKVITSFLLNMYLARLVTLMCATKVSAW